MTRTIFPTDKFQQTRTPFYYYDLNLLRQTLQTIETLALPSNYKIHYALKANVNPAVLQTIAQAGFGADCVSGGEVQAALDAGFSASKIVFAGVGKADWEIELALNNAIGFFNVESLPELEVIDELAGKKGVVANIALRINPNVDAATHKYITTGLDENKFGIGLNDIPTAIALLKNLRNIRFRGIHLHVGSQITEMKPFKELCMRIGEIQSQFEAAGVKIESINAGGGLGVDYMQPDENPIPDFKQYFDVFRENLALRSDQELHFELGRAIVAQCGTLVSRVLYVKTNGEKQFVILDAGMTDLIRPALYEAHHHVENISSNFNEAVNYDVVGPICESSDVFIENFPLKKTQRGDLIALRSAGAYGEIMASGYNLRPLPKAYTSDEMF